MNNIIIVKTALSQGTGIVFSCLKRKEKDINSTFKDSFSFFNGYIALTAYHVVSDALRSLESEKDEEYNYNSIISFDIFDKRNQLIEKSTINIIDVAFDKKFDICALYFEISDKSNYVIDNYIDDINDNIDASVIGYPSVMSNDSYSNRVTLAAKVDNIELKDENKRRIVIETQYNYYETLNDLDLSKGFSGSPVTYNKENKPHILGIVTEIPNVLNGKNPFKYMYFITIQKVFSILHYNGFIENQPNIKGTISLRWVKHITKDTKLSDDKKSDNEETKRILVTGSSGAGKSTFIKSFASNSRWINSTGDGQTTRCIYHYNFSRKYCNSDENICFKLLTQENFTESRSKRVYLRIIDWIFKDILSLKSVEKETTLSIYDDSYIYLKYLYGKMAEYDFEQNNEKSEDAEEKKISLKELKKELKKIIESTAYIVNPEEEDVFKEYRKILEYLIYLPQEDRDILKKTKIDIDYIKIKKYKLENNNEEYTEIQNNISYKKLSDILLYDKGLFDIKEFEFLFNKTGKKYSDNFEKIYNFIIGIDEHALNDELLKILKFSFKFPIETQSFTDNQNYGKSQSSNETQNSKSNKNPIMEFYDTLHSFLKDAIKTYTDSLPNCKEIDIRKSIYGLSFMNIKNSKEIRDLAACVFKINKFGHSLTSMIDYVDVYDNFSEQYAFMFDDISVKEIVLIDSKGLDHIEEGTTRKTAFLDIFHFEKLLNDEKFKTSTDPFDAIIYLKKLDSGKPDELSEMIPFFYNLSAKIPVFSVFTGADIFYGKTDTIIDTENEKIKLPNSIEYLKSDKFEKHIYKMIRNKSNHTKVKLKVYKSNLSIVSLSEDLSLRKRYELSNIFNMSRLFSSIVSDASNNIAFLSETPNFNNVDLLIDQFIKKLFLEASVDWNSTSAHHYSTVQANYRRIFGNERNGFKRTYDHLWGSLFYNSFETVIPEYASKISENIGISSPKIESIILGMGKDFLGRADILNAPNSTDKGKFKDILDEMYKSKNISGEKIYEDRIKKDEKDIPTNIKRNELSKMTDFSKGLGGIYNGRKILDKFSELFKNVLKGKIENNDAVTVNNLYKAYPNIRKACDEWIDSLSKVLTLEEDKSENNELKAISNLFLKNILKNIDTNNIIE